MTDTTDAMIAVRVVCEVEGRDVAAAEDGERLDREDGEDDVGESWAA